MQLRVSPDTHLTYCLNIHPGERLQDVEAALVQAAAVRDLVAPGAPFAAGLRLSDRTAAELTDDRLPAFRERLAQRDLYVFTINGFPFGPFHGRAVKAAVYEPDWRTPARLRYTRRLARILAALLPPGMEGSISTVPGSYAPWIQTPADREAVARGLVEAARACAVLHAETGQCIRVALEPEPGCMLDTVQAAIRFLEEAVYAGAGREETTLRTHLGLCLDTCHASVEGEPIAPAMRRALAAGVPIAKIQLSAALRTPNTKDGREALAAFADETYLHPLRAVLPSGAVRRWPDLPEALAALPELPSDAQCATHVHVPMDWAGEPPLSSTRADLDAECWSRMAGGICPHLEIETYTFSVLPARLRVRSAAESIAAEFGWVLDRLKEAGAPTPPSPGASGTAGV